MEIHPNLFSPGLTEFVNNPETNKRKIEFTPLLSLQRYASVSELIRTYSQFNPGYNFTSVTEFGCGSFVFFYNYLINNDTISRINQVDIDVERINSALHVISTERNRRVASHNQERSPLIVNVFQGNIATNDSRLLHSDVVVGIEIIEHLLPDDFANFPDVIFGYMKPKLAIFTTPNYDFNELFDNDMKFRHPDHKFEFTKKEFENWTNEIIEKFPNYDVSIYGIGPPPLGHEKLGCCSQMAVFKKKDLSLPPVLNENEFINYTLIGSYEYFNFNDDVSLESKVMEKIQWAIFKYGDDEKVTSQFQNKDCEYQHNTICLPLSFLKSECGSLCDDSFFSKLLNDHTNVYPLKTINEVVYIVVENECESSCI